MPAIEQCVRAVVVESLMVLTGVRDAEQIADGARPIGDLGLDSVDGVDLALELEDRLGFKIDERANPLVDDGLRRARTVREIVKWLIAQMATEQEGNAHG